MMKLIRLKFTTFVLLLIVLLFSLSVIYFYRQRVQADQTITDFHTHLLSDELVGEVKAYIGTLDPTIQMLGEKCSADEIISQMDKAGVDKALVFSGAYLWCTQLPDKQSPIIDSVLQYCKVKEENSWAAEQARRYPDRLIPVFSINPLKDYAIGEMDRCIDELGVTAMKLHLGSSMVNFSDAYHLKKLDEVLSHAEKRKIPVIIHIWSRYSKPTDGRIIADKILAKHPKLRICIAHLGYIGEPEMKVMEAIASAADENKCIHKENVFFDMSAVIWTENTKNLLPETSQETLNKMTALIRRWGPDKILWGSDFFAREPEEFMSATLTHLDLDENEIQTLLYKRPEDFLKKKSYLR